MVQREIAPAPVRRATRRFNSDRSPYDREAWRRLIESDPDLAQLTAVLSDFGPQYVDELATSYLADPDKSRLGAIVDGIIAKAGRANPLLAAAPPEDSKPVVVPEPAVAPTRDIDVSSARNESDSGLSPAKPPAAEIEAPPSVTVVAASAPPASDPPPVDPPRPDRERRDIPITAVDDDLSEMIKKFAPDSNFLRRN